MLEFVIHQVTVMLCYHNCSPCHDILPVHNFLVGNSTGLSQRNCLKVSTGRSVTKKKIQILVHVIRNRLISDVMHVV